MNVPFKGRGGIRWTDTESTVGFTQSGTFKLELKMIEIDQGKPLYVFKI